MHSDFIVIICYFCYFKSVLFKKTIVQLKVEMMGFITQPDDIYCKINQTLRFLK